jgi:hypothetical protein
MNNDFKRLQELAGLLTESEQPPQNEEHEYILSLFSDLANSGNPIYNGLMDVLNSKELMDDINWTKEASIENNEEDGGDEDDWESEFEYKLGGVVLSRFGEQYIKNLLDNGFTYNSDEETWTVPDSQKDNFGSEEISTINIIDKFDTSDGVFLDSMASDFIDNYPNDINEKTNMNKEFKRMQELAGIVKEETEYT